MPLPSSKTQTTAAPPSSFAVTPNFPPSFENFTALSRRFRHTCPSNASSPDIMMDSSVTTGSSSLADHCGSSSMTQRRICSSRQKRVTSIFCRPSSMRERRSMFSVILESRALSFSIAAAYSPRCAGESVSSRKSAA